jgi:anti-sigma28 factor (negative regulator of flagellin synthesis)
MSEIRSIEGLSPLRVEAKPASGSQRQAASGGTAVEDTVEISDLARALSDELEATDIRIARVAEIRAAIERGDYLTPEKLDAALDAALKDL